MIDNQETKKYHCNKCAYIYDTKEEFKMMKSKKYKLNLEDAKKIGKGALIAVGGAVLTFALGIITQVDFGQYSLVVVSISTILINAGLKYCNGRK